MFEFYLFAEFSNMDVPYGTILDQANNRLFQTFG